MQITTATILLDGGTSGDIFWVCAGPHPLFNMLANAHDEALPAASLLKMGYASACLLLIVRGLEQQGERLGPAVFLTTQVLGGVASQETTSSSTSEDGIINSNLHQAAAKHARTLLQIFLQMPGGLQNSISSNRCLCLTYAALVLARYDETRSRLSDAENLQLIKQLHGWFSRSPSKVVLAKYTVLCEQIVLGRLQPESRGEKGRSGTRAGCGRDDFPPSAGLDPAETADMQIGSAQPGTFMEASTAVLHSTGGHLDDPNPIEFGRDDSALFDMLPHINLEDFFTGGYLDL